MCLLQCRSSRAGKSVRKWLPRLSVRLSAAVAQSRRRRRLRLRLVVAILHVDVVVAQIGSDTRMRSLDIGFEVRVQGEEQFVRVIRRVAELFELLPKVAARRERQSLRHN